MAFLKFPYKAKEHLVGVSSPTAEITVTQNYNGDVVISVSEPDGTRRIVLQRADAEVLAACLYAYVYSR